MISMPFEIKRLDPSLKDDFFRIHSQENDFGFCHCVFWRVPIREDWDKRSTVQNRKLREKLFEKGISDGYLLYIDHEPIAWCQCCPIEDLVRLKQRVAFEDGDKYWVIPCLLMKKSHRSRGYMKKMLGMVLEDLKVRDVKRVRAYPKVTEVFDPMDNWTGSEEMFQDLGFKKIDERRGLAIYEREL